MELCNKCSKRSTCVELCSAAEKYVSKDYVPLRELLECDMSMIIEEVIEIEDYPEGCIELDVKDWVYLLKNSNMTKLQRKYVYLHYWKWLSYSCIGRAYEVSKQSVAAATKRGRDRIAISLIKLSGAKVEGHVFLIPPRN